MPWRCDRLVVNNAYKTKVDCCPFGAAIHAHSHVKLKGQVAKYGFPSNNESPFNISIVWKDSTLAPPQLRMIRPIRVPFQRTLQKVTSSIGPIR